MSVPPPGPADQTRERSVRLLAVLAEMAHVDGDLDADERRFLYHVAAEHPDLSGADVDAALAHVGEVAAEAQRHADALDRDGRVEVLRYLITMMQSDRVVSRKELGMIRRHGAQLGVPADRLDDFGDMALNSRQAGLTGAALAARIETYLAGDGMDSDPRR